MSLVFFALGAGLLLLGRIKITFADIDEEGPRVRAAGLVLMVPLIVRLFLSFMVGTLTGGDREGVVTGLEIVSILDFVAIIVATAVAYMLLFPQGKSPSIDFGNWQKPSDDNESDENAQNGHANPQPPPAPTTPNMQKQAAPRMASGQFPRVMNIAQAAHYLNVTEQQIMDAIDNNKLAAARINYRYSISRSALDDFRETHLSGGSATS